MKFSNIKLLGEVYAALHSVGLVRSKGEFSQRLIGKGASYLTSTSAKRREPANTTVEALLTRLQILCAQYEESPHCGSTYAVSFTKRHLQLQTLCQLLETHLQVQVLFGPVENVIPLGVSK